MITPDQLRKIITGIELLRNEGKPIGTKIDGVVVSLHENQLSGLVEAICHEINDQFKINKEVQLIANMQSQDACEVEI